MSVRAEGRGVSAILPAERRADTKLRGNRNLQLALQEIERYVGTHHRGRIILSWREDGQVEMEQQQHWHPPKAGQ